MLLNRLTVVVIAFCMMLNLSSPAFAEGTIDSSEGASGGKLATSAECGLGLTEVAMIIGSLYVTYLTIKRGIKLAWDAAHKPDPVTKAAKLAMSASLIATGTTAAITLAMTSVSLQCMYSFVRDPVLRDENDPTKMRKKDDLEALTDNYWEAAPAAYSDIVQVCARLVVPFSYWFTDGSCNHVGKDRYNPDKYGGEDSFLCPEEWRAVGYIRDADAQGNILSENAVPDPSSPRYNPQIIDMKKVSAPLACSLGKQGDNFTMHGYGFVIKNMGSKRCAILTGLVGLPSSSYTVGCHYGPPEPPQPMCSTSVPIRDDAEKDPMGNPIPGTGSGEIIGYDDISCVSCYVSMWCNTVVNTIAQSMISVAAPVIQCIQESANLLLYGCSTSDGAREGYMYVAQVQLAKAVQIAVALAIALYALGILLSIGDIKRNEFMAFLMKAVFVLIMTAAVSASSGGGAMQYFSTMVYKFANGIANIFVSGGLHNGLCAYLPQDYIIDREVMDPGGTITTVKQDFGYMMYLDIMDCMVSYLLGLNILTMTQLDGGMLVTLGLNLLFLPIALIFSFFDILGSLICVFFGVMVVFLIIWCLLFSVLVVVGRMLVIIVSPLFIPCLLTSYTRGFFDGWLKEFISYHVFPAVIAGFVGFVFSIYSVMFFGNTKFVETMTKIGGKNYKYFAVDDTHCYEIPENDSPDSEMVEVCGCDPRALGCKLGQLEFFTGSLFFGVKGTKVASADVTAKELAGIAIVSFLLVRFTVIVPGLAAEIAGGSRSILIMVKFISTPTQMASKVLGNIKKMISGKSSNKGGDKGGGGKGGEKGGYGGGGGGGSGDSMRSSGGGGDGDSMKSRG